MKIAKETWIIFVIGLADLITTIVFIRHQGAQEANPLFRRYWEMGLSSFIVAKCALLLGPLFVLEWARRHNPRFVSRALRGGIAAYLVMYGVGFVRLNQRRAEPDFSGLPAAPLIIRPRLTGAADRLPSAPAGRAPHTVSAVASF